MQGDKPFGEPGMMLPEERLPVPSHVELLYYQMVGAIPSSTVAKKWPCTQAFVQGMVEAQCGFTNSHTYFGLHQQRTRWYIQGLEAARIESEIQTAKWWIAKLMLKET